MTARVAEPVAQRPGDGRWSDHGAIGEADLREDERQEEEAGAVDGEAAGGADPPVERARDGRAQRPRQVELHRVERDSVQQLFGPDQARNDGLHRGPPECARRPRHHRDRDHVPHGEVAGRGQECEGERREADHHLAPEHDRAATRPVRDRAADEPEDEDRHVPAEADRTEKRGRARHAVDEPAEGDLLHPEADVRDQRAGPEETIVPVAERTEHGATSSRRAHHGQTAPARRSWIADVGSLTCRRRDARRDAWRAP